VALRPQPPVPQFFQPPDPVPLHGMWASVVAAALLVVGLIDQAFKAIAARWRGIVLAHLFFLTLWLAVQVFFFATGAYWCFPSESSKVVEWFSKHFPQISRCGPTLSSYGSLAPSNSLAATPVASPKASPPDSPSVSSAAASTPSTPGPAAAPSSGSAAAWSSRSVSNCWRDRSVGNSCYARAEPHRKVPPARFRYPAFPCRRPHECGWDAI
jgi:hypothetical protein